MLTLTHLLPGILLRAYDNYTPAHSPTPSPLPFLQSFTVGSHRSASNHKGSVLCFLKAQRQDRKGQSINCPTLRQLMRATPAGIEEEHRGFCWGKRIQIDHPKLPSVWYLLRAGKKRLKILNSNILRSWIDKQMKTAIAYLRVLQFDCANAIIGHRFLFQQSCFNISVSFAVLFRPITITLSLQ